MSVTAVVLAAATEAPPPMALALEDYVPVALSVLALVLVASWVAARRGVTRSDAALVGVVLVAVGGLSKATWKLVYATGPDITWMDELLFPFLATGFTILAQVVARVDDPDGDNRALAAGGLAGGIGLVAWVVSGFETAETWWLIVMVMASTALVLLLIVQARRAGERRGVVLFAVHLVLTFTLAGLARVGEQSWALQWVEQLSNTLSQGLLALGVWWLWQTARRTAPVHSLTDVIATT